MVDSLENMYNDYSSGGFSNIEIKDAFDAIVSGISLIGIFTPVGWGVGATTSAYYLVRIIVDELKED